MIKCPLTEPTSGPDTRSRCVSQHSSPKPTPGLTHATHADTERLEHAHPGPHTSRSHAKLPEARTPAHMDSLTCMHTRLHTLRPMNTDTRTQTYTGTPMHTGTLARVQTRGEFLSEHSRKAPPGSAHWAVQPHCPPEPPLPPPRGPGACARLPGAAGWSRNSQRPDLPTDPLGTAGAATAAGKVLNPGTRQPALFLIYIAY